MRLYRKNIGAFQQVARIALGAATTVAGPLWLTGLPACAVVAAGSVFALTGVVGYCPACALIGMGRGGGAAT